MKWDVWTMIVVAFLFSAPMTHAATYYVDNAHLNTDDGWPLGANSQSFIIGSDFSVNDNYTPFDSPLGFDFDYTCLYNPGSDFPSAASLGTNNVTGNPSFQGSDYDIGSSSSCRDTGLYSGIALDFDGDTRDANYDIGAQEY